MVIKRNIRSRPHTCYPSRLVISALIGLAVLLFSLLPVFAAEKSIGIILTGDIRDYREIHSIFMSRLSRDGHTDNVKVLVQTPYPDSISLSNAVRKLIAIDVDVIVTYGATAAIAAYNEKTRIPIVYVDVYDPLASKLKAANITGISSKLSISSLLRYMKSISSVKNLGILYNSGEDDSSHQARELYKLSDQYGLKADAININRQRNIKAVLAGRKFDALIITHSCVASMAAQDIDDFIKTHKVPTASLMPGKNCIITLHSSHKEQGEKSAEKVIKILNGVPPEKIARTISSDTELIFNLKEVVSMGLDIPVELVTEATKLIK